MHVVRVREVEIHRHNANISHWKTSDGKVMRAFGIGKHILGTPEMGATHDLQKHLTLEYPGLEVQ